MYSFSIKRSPPIRKAVYEWVKKMVEWKVSDSWDEENSWLLEGRTVLIFKGGDRKDPAKYRPSTCLPTITKMVTLAIHKRMRGWLFGMVERSIQENEQRGVRSSQGCKEAAIENLASNMKKKREENEVIELDNDIQKEYDNDNHAFLENLLSVYGFPPGIKIPNIEMMARWKIQLSKGAKKEVGDVRLTNGIIQGDALSPLLFVLMIDPLIKIDKRRVGEGVEVLFYVDDMKASSSGIQIAQTVVHIMKRYSASVGMVINAKKSAIQLNFETPLPQSLQEIPRLDESTDKYLGFEMKRGEIDMKQMMMKRLEERIKEKLEEPTRRVGSFESRNWVQYVNQNVMNVVRFFNRPSGSPSGGLTETTR